MSRTLKDRPYWIRRNDSRYPRRETHDHRIRLSEKIGEREEVVREAEFFYDEETGTYNKIPEIKRTYPIYHYWYEDVPCSIDMVDDRSGWYYRLKQTNDEKRAAKHCFHWLEVDGDYRSGKDWKRLTNQAVRGKVKQQLHRALNDSGKWTDYWGYLEEFFPEITLYDRWEYEGICWEEVDIFTDSKYDSRGWYDW